MPKIQNTFTGGLNQDISDLIRKNDSLRGALNIRIIDLDSSTYAVTLVDGTEDSFVLTPGYYPLASREYNGILYIVSRKAGTAASGVEGQEGFIAATEATIEIGSYPSPNYADPVATDFNVYRPFNNLDDGFPFRTSIYEYKDEDFVDLVLQPEYDNSINAILISKGHSMRIVNSKFERLSPNTNDNPTSEIVYKVIPDREGNANSNTYTSASLDKETSLILNSDKILKIDYNSIEDGGQLTYGNYVYVFEYMTEDFNSTDVVGQSGLCSVFSGDNENNIKGGFQNDAANKLVKLDLTNVDTDFRYFKVHFKYSSGTRDAEYNAVFEMTSPIPITGETMTFIHSGFEETVEVAESTINIDSSIIDSAATGEAVGGYLMLGDIVEREYDYTDFKEVAKQVTMSEVIHQIGINSDVYTNPENVYSYMGYFGGETYPWSMIFVLPDGKLTPPFPVEGKDMLKNGEVNSKGLFRHSNSNNKPIFTDVSSAKNIEIKHVKFDILSVNPADLAAIQEKSLGFFFVRGDRKADLITQSLLVPTLRVPPLDAKTGTN